MGETFIVKILYTRNSSWQGSVDWVNAKGRKTQFFRSALELIRLIDDVVGSEKRREWEETSLSAPSKTEDKNA